MRPKHCRLPPARSVVKDLPPELIPSYQAGAAECPRAPWTFYAAMGKHSVIMAAT